VQKQCEKGMHA
ncbi:hypothetical protein BVRB_020840, partial [Beta vulgaris subsp. vulgaris]